MVQSRQRSEFVLIEKGIHIFKVEDFTEDKPEKWEELRSKGDNWKNFILHLRISGGAEDGLPMLARFSRISKNDFALGNLLMALEVCGAVKPGADIPPDQFDDPQFVPRMKAKVTNQLFGADVVHTKGKKKNEDGSYPTFANLGKLFTLKEAGEILKKGKGNGADVTHAVSVTASEAKTDSVSTNTTPDKQKSIWD